MIRIRHFISCVLGAAVLLTGVGCKLIFEPSDEAVNRMFRSMPTGEHRVVNELCDGEQICQQLNRLASMISSEWYGKVKDFFTITEIEIAEDTGYQYVHVELRIPASGSQREQMIPLVFEMERIKLRWHIYKAEGLDDYLRRATRARGIL